MTTTTNTSNDHLRSLLNTTNSTSTTAPIALNLSGLMSRVKVPIRGDSQAQPKKGEEREEILLPHHGHGLSLHPRHDLRPGLDHGPMKYVPSPTLSYYAHFIPVTPATTAGLPLLGKVVSPDSSSNSDSNSTTTTTTTTKGNLDSHRTTYRTRRKPPPPALDLSPPPPPPPPHGDGQMKSRMRDVRHHRALPEIILLDSPVDEVGIVGAVDVDVERIEGGGRGEGVGAARRKAQDQDQDQHLPSRPPFNLRGEDQVGSDLVEVDSSVRRGIKGLWRSMSKSKSHFKSKSHPSKPDRWVTEPEPSPEWVEIEQGYRHPSCAFGLDLDIRGIDLLKPVTDKNEDTGRPQPPPSGSSPRTGGILHDILLTPTYGPGGSSSSSSSFPNPGGLRRTPTPRRHAAAGESTLNLLPTRSSTVDPPRNRDGRRLTLLDKAGRMLNDQRMKLVYPPPPPPPSQQTGEKLDRSGVRVGGIVPFSLTGYMGKNEGEMDRTAPGFMEMHRIPSHARMEERGGSFHDGKPRYGLDSARDGSRWGSGGGGVEKGENGVGMRTSTADRDMLIRKQRRKKIWILMALVLLILASAVIGLCAGLLTRKSSSSTESPETSDTQNPTSTSTSTSPTASPTSSAYTLSTCLSLFALSAPTAPTSYPCDQCLSILNTGGVNDYRTEANDGAGPSGNSTGVGAAIQFCALQSIFASTGGTTGGQRKRAGVLDGWMVNTNPCSGWSGVTCDGKARVRSLSLVYPGVPSALDESIGGLVGLESIKIVGNSVLPAGPIPDSIFSSTLKTIEIQSTGLTSLGANAFASLATLTSLVLVSNAKLGSTLPALPQTLGLSTISVTGQSLSADPFPALPASLSYIDFSYNALSGSMPSLSKFIGLQSLFLDSNNYVSISQDFPPSLQDLSLQNNPSLAGALPVAICSSTSLKTCELQGTSLGAANAQNTTTTQVGAIATRVVNATATTTIMTTATAVSTTAPRCGVCRF